MRNLTLICVLMLAGCSEWAQINTSEAKQVQVFGRTWTVSEVQDKPNAYVAQRDNNNLQPFGRPVMLRTPQAVRALELATGCKVVRGSLTQDTSAIFSADMTCSR